jgi:TonB family protein
MMIKQEGTLPPLQALLGSLVWHVVIIVSVLALSYCQSDQRSFDHAPSPTWVQAYSYSVAHERGHDELASSAAIVAPPTAPVDHMISESVSLDRPVAMAEATRVLEDPLDPLAPLDPPGVVEEPVIDDQWPVELSTPASAQSVSTDAVQAPQSLEQRVATAVSSPAPLVAEEVIAIWLPRIQKQVTDHWLRPVGLPVPITAVVNLRLMPNGMPEHIEIIESSGYPAFDASVKAAIYQAAPLPVPADAGFELFRDFNFRFRS